MHPHTCLPMHMCTHTHRNTHTHTHFHVKAVTPTQQVRGGLDPMFLTHSWGLLVDSERCGPRRQRNEVWLYFVRWAGSDFSYHLYLPLGRCQPHMQPAFLFSGCLLKKKLCAEPVTTWSIPPSPPPTCLSTLPVCSYPLHPGKTQVSPIGS